MTIHTTIVQNAYNELRDVIVLNSSELISLMDCSLRTVQRRVRDWGCYTSYNHNGSYYALPEIVHFDQYGIWEFQCVCFSHFGNLKKTVAGVIHQAPQGLTAGELADQLHVNVHSFLSQFATLQIFTRQKFSGTFRYFSADPARAKYQREYYLTSAPSIPPAPLTNEAAVKLLLAWIDDPDPDPLSLSQRLSFLDVHVTAEAVALFLSQHNLLGKKKPT